MDTIFDKVGPASLHHVCIRCAPGWFISAKAFFKELLSCWHSVPPNGEDKDCRWESVQFMTPGTVIIQIIEPKEGDHFFDEFVHIALAVADPGKTAQLIKETYEHAGKDVAIIELGGGNWWVEIRWLFGCAIELVPLR